jgi:hypothetical protein
MGIDSILQQNMQNAGIAGINQLAGNAMYPQSQQVNTQFATPSQMPTSSEVVNAGYEPKLNAYTGMPVQNFADGGDVEDPQQMESTPEAVDYKAQIDQLYQGILGRSPDEGAKDWENLLLAGYDISEVGRQIGASSEAQKKAVANISPEIRANDPNNFAGTITELYASALGRTPDAASLEADINLLNRNPDAFAWLANSVTKSPEAQAYAEKSGVDLQKAYDNNIVNYKHFTPTPKQGGIAGFANQYGYLAPLLLAGGAMAAPYLAGTAAAGTAGAGGSIGGIGLGGAFVPTAGSGASFLVPGAAAAAGGAGAAGGLDAYMASAGLNPGTFSGSGFALPSSAAAGSGAFGLSPELAAEIGLEGATSGLSTSGAQGSAALEAMGLNAGSGGITAKQAYAAKMGLDMLNAGAGGQQTAGYAVPTASAPATIPTVNRFGVTGYEGQIPVAEVSQRPILLSKIKGVGGDYTFAEGGIATLGSYSDGGQLLKGPGDGMSDNIPAKIGEAQPARLADGEFVIPADVVSHLGNGSTDAGAKQLYSMMDKIRKARTGNKKQGKQINPSKFLP